MPQAVPKKVMANKTGAVDKVRLLNKIVRLPEGVMREADRALRLHRDLL